MSSPERRTSRARSRPSISDFDHNAFDEEGNLKIMAVNTGARRQSVNALVDSFSEAQSGSFSRIQVVTVITLCLATFLDSICYSLLAPFYPKEAASKGVNGTVVGLVFGVFELVIFLTSPIFGSYITRIGSRFMLISGVGVCSVTTIMFGFLDGCPGGWIYILMNFLVRIIEAVGASAFVTASFAIVANTFPHRVASMFGLLETFNGLGMMVGPVIGGALYELGGFKLPFLVTGCLLVVAGLVAFIILPPQNDAPNTKAPGSLGGLLKIPGVIIVCVLLFIDSCTIGFMEPTLAKHLDQFGLNTALVGVMFFIAPGLYALSSPFWGWISDRFGFTKSIFLIGSLGVGVSYLLLGPCPLIEQKSELWLVIVSLVMLGLSFGASFVPVLNECLILALDNGYRDDFETYGLVSGVINSCFSLGGFVGPIGGGAMVEALGFDWSAAILGFIVIGLAGLSIMYYCLAACCGWTEERNDFTESEETEPDVNTPLLAPNRTVDV